MSCSLSRANQAGLQVRAGGNCQQAPGKPLPCRSLAGLGQGEEPEASLVALPSLPVADTRNTLYAQMQPSTVRHCATYYIKHGGSRVR